MGGTTYRYYYADSKLMRLTWGSNTVDFIYDANGTPYAMKYNGTLYYYVTNLQGDVMRIVNASGTVAASYDYDPYGKVISATGTLANVNPLRYRGYVYDQETGFYYVSSRYYDPAIGRWINADITETLTADFENFAQYNLFAYCFNNPVNMSDKIGAWPSWVTKAGAVVAVAAAVVTATVVTVATCGAGSVAGVAVITATATIAAKATEVTALQVKKGKSEGKSGSQIAVDCIESVFNNGGKIISPALTKAGTTSATYVVTDLIKHKVVPLGFNTFLKSTGGKVLPYGFAAYAWGNTAYSIFCSDPIARANQRGYSLR